MIKHKQYNPSLIIRSRNNTNAPRCKKLIVSHARNTDKGNAMFLSSIIVNSPTSLTSETCNFNIFWKPRIVLATYVTNCTMRRDASINFHGASWKAWAVTFLRRFQFQNCLTRFRASWKIVLPVVFLWFCRTGRSELMVFSFKPVFEVCGALIFYCFIIRDFGVRTTYMKWRFFC